MEGVGEGEAETERLMEEVAVLDFDMLCAAVALQTQGVKVERRIEKEEEENRGDDELGGVQRMWEGDVLGCLEDQRIAMEAVCCPCCRFGKNMGRAGLGPCFLQGIVYLTLLALALSSFIAFGIAKQHYFLYVGIASTILVLLYSGYFRARIRKMFNIRGSGSSLEDCIIHLLCPCCTLCQESRTLEMNNVQDGIWHGRCDTICIGKYGEGSKEFNLLHKSSLIPTKNPESCNMERACGGNLPIIQSED
ncbi:uncharacterized protein LOC110031159 [Phalaenopsis equestris]|uniref:uncharacterized protein LOC110031159 n=1 Tax=Phalaenopsis equestris TaxID=78828 RepID=UPI0009E326E1|nr:uncharacterized protein LOC110031159 [Phalaenopsis equestris]